MDLKGYLADTGETQVQFAKRARLSQSQVSRMLRKLNTPRGDTLERTLAAIGRKPPSRGNSPALRDLMPRRKPKGGTD